MSEEKEARGLWIGVPVPKELVPEGTEIYSWLPKKEPHITLIHLGRTNNEHYVRNLAQWLSWGTFRKEVSLEITGVGYFWRNGFSVKVALINSAELFELRSQLISELTRRNVNHDQKFGFIPHITLSSKAELRDRGTTFRVVAPGPKLVWGDVEFKL